MSKTISIVVPVFNEEGNIPHLFDVLSKVLRAIKNYDYEIIFINDGSADHSAEAIKEIIAGNQKVSKGKIKYIEFSRNFGKEMAITAGLNACIGDCAIIIDADLQHPPEIIPTFIAEWQKGFEVVVGIRKNCKSDTWIKVLGSKLFYKIMSRISETDIRPNSTDFCLLDRKVIDAFNKCAEKTRITRGLIAWLGFKKSYIEFEAGARVSGKAGYSTAKLIKLALSSFVSMSLFPLKLAGYLGLFITAISGFLGLFILVDMFMFNNSFGFTHLAGMTVMILFLIGIVLSCLGLIALYIANIQDEVVGRPMYVVRESSGDCL
jgi:dolichol-phosphate mannosyltransferase